MVTITVAVPDILPLVAMTVLAYVPGVGPAVNRPDALIVPPPETTDQVGVSDTLAPAKSVPTAENCCVPFTVRVAGFGETTIADSEPGSLIPCTSHAAADSPASAIAAKTRAARARGASACMMRILMTLLIELLLT
jgi:hypothetical protein